MWLRRCSGRYLSARSVAGDRLPNERELAQRCEVSRATVREAMLALELSGVIDVRQGAGSFLTGLGVQSGNVAALPADSSPRELLQVRQIVEPTVAQLCTHSARKRDLEHLSELIDKARRESDSMAAGHLDRFVALSLAFHRELAALCGNSVLASLTSHLVSAAEHPLWALVDGIVVRNPETRDKQLEEHRAILRPFQWSRGASIFSHDRAPWCARLEALRPGRPPPVVTRSRRRRSA